MSANPDGKPLYQAGKIVGGLIGAAVMGFALTLAGTAAGAVVGWCVGLFFTKTLHAAEVAFGIGPIAPWQLGAFLGFAGSFFKTAPATKAKA